MEKNVNIIKLKFYSWVKILNGKLLIFSSKEQSKANIIYDLNECEVTAKINTVNKEEANSPIKSDYQVTIDHPYLQKCFLKSEYIFETLEFYNNIKQFVN
jgi:hypothetical protein